MERPSSKKTIWTIILTVLLAFAVGIILCLTFSTRYYVRAKEDTMVEVYDKIARSVEAGEDVSDSDVSGDISALCDENAISVLIMSSSGEIQYLYGNPWILLERMNDAIFGDDDPATIVTDDQDYLLQVVETDGQRYIELLGALSDGSWFIERASYSGISSSVWISLRFFMAVFISVFLIIAFLIYRIVKPYSDAIDRLTEFSQKVAEGDFDPSMLQEHKYVNNELGILGDNLEEITRKLEKSMAELKTKNLELQKDLEKKISEEEARKKYMSDVSHELKTPIALISGYAEGLKEGISEDPEDRIYYCDVIIDEAEKMNLMVKKLADLNLLENSSNEVQLEQFDVVAVIDGFLNTMALVIEEKEIDVFFDNSKSVGVWSDEFLFEEVLMNYFNNAVNHLNEKKTIRISVDRRDDKTVRVTVSNTGEHIDESEQDKIWGKFYKVDAARSREYGGSGLGLSIVKAIADATKQKCGVYNVEDGVAFWIEVEAAEKLEKEWHDTDEGDAEYRRVTVSADNTPVWKKATKALQGKGEKNK